MRKRTLALVLLVVSALTVSVCAALQVQQQRMSEKIIRLHVDVQQIAEIALRAALDDRLMVLHRHVERRGGLTRQTDERVAVRAVVGDLEFHDGVVVADDDVHVFADRAALVVQDPDAVGIRLRAVMLGEAQLFV